MARYSVTSLVTISAATSVVGYIRITQIFTAILDLPHLPPSKKKS